MLQENLSSNEVTLHKDGSWSPLLPKKESKEPEVVKRKLETSVETLSDDSDDDTVNEVNGVYPFSPSIISSIPGKTDNVMLTQATFCNVLCLMNTVPDVTLAIFVPCISSDKIHLSIRIASLQSGLIIVGSRENLEKMVRTALLQFRGHLSCPVVCIVTYVVYIFIHSKGFLQPQDQHQHHQMSAIVRKMQSWKSSSSLTVMTTILLHQPSVPRLAKPRHHLPPPRLLQVYHDP